ncbi:MAG: patatin-like phospholipase family protein [Oligoflexia bacterium]|nr:patatin-like phospholipase family protein [Oligoflexia bacterium]
MPQSGRSNASSKIAISKKRKIAFVCSGGATKAGAFHLGVALALKEHGFRFYGGLATEDASTQSPRGPMDISTYVGSSAGSIVSSYFAAGYSLDNIFNSFLHRAPQDGADLADLVPRVLPRLTYQKMFKLRTTIAREQISQFTFFRNTIGKLMQGDWEALFQLQWLKAQGMFSTSGIEAYMREEVLPSNRFQDYLADLFIVATQLNHSRKVVFGKYGYQPPPWDLTCQYDNDVTISNACAASTALPLIYAPYPIKNENNRIIYYIDGEIRDTLSTHVAIDAGCDLVFASYTHQPYHYTKDIGSLTDYGLPRIAVQSIYLLVEQKINNHIFNRECHSEAIDAVSDYCKDQGISEEHRRRLCEILEQSLHHRRDTDVIYIHPNPADSHLFFEEHFTLSSKKMAEVVRSGFRAGVETLRKYEFADRSAEPAISRTL